MLFRSLPLFLRSFARAGRRAQAVHESDRVRAEGGVAGGRSRSWGGPGLAGAKPSRIPSLSPLWAFVLLTGAWAGQPIDPLSPRLPQPGDYAATLLSPSLIQLTAISAPAENEAPIPLPGELTPAAFEVEVGGVPANVTALGFKRRVLYAPIKARDLRVATEVYLQLAAPVPDSDSSVKVTANAPAVWPHRQTVELTLDPGRYSPALHVNQEGYVPDLPKTALVGYYLGTLGEMPVPAEAGFEVVDAKSGAVVFQGPLRIRRDQGFNLNPRPYQAVYEADFSAFTTPGRYRLRVPGLGASVPFRIDEGALLNAVRTYALGLYHQRCGQELGLPYTRFGHGACHLAPAEVPMPAGAFGKAWEIIRKLDEDSVKPERPELQLKYPEQMKYPFVRTGKVAVHGGHHDAGDYSKYTTNSATLVHPLMFAVDSFPGVSELDNLGLPESGDGIGDLLQEAKWEADFLSRLQDDDGGFYFLVYPRERRYENDRLPAPGDPQIVWPKTTAATAAAVAALAQCAGSPAFKRHYPEDAKRYLAQAERGWKFLLQALERHGRAKAYQRLTHYGDDFQDTDELAWAAAELFVATGDLAYEKKLMEWFPDPTDGRTKQYQWRRASSSYGNAMRSYAFAASSGRLPRTRLAGGYLAKCEAELRRAGEDAARWADQSAYGTSYPEPSKRINAAGWYFSSDQAFDITVAYQLQKRPNFVRTVLTNLNYEAGANPVNRAFLTGMGVRGQREIVHQFSQNDERVLPLTGIPIGNLYSQFSYLGPYKNQLKELSWPRDDGDSVYPLYDRWSDAYNWNAEFVVTNQARALASLAFWAAGTKAKGEPWKAASARIVGADVELRLGRPTTLRLEAEGLDLSEARIVWEGRGQEPAFGAEYVFTPRSSGPQWIEAEAVLPDGRRVFARATPSATAPVVLWVNGSLPAGAVPYAKDGDTWNWIKAATKPAELQAHLSAPQHESALANGIHEHGFHDATDPLLVERGDILFAYIFIDPQNVPATIMLEWKDGSNEHRAFWGRNEIPYGRMNTESQRPMGPLPPAGRWVRLDVPASAVGLEGRSITGMVFRLHGGRARWDAVGKLSAAAAKSSRLEMPPPVRE